MKKKYAVIPYSTRTFEHLGKVYIIKQILWSNTYMTWSQIYITIHI